MSHEDAHAAAPLRVVHLSPFPDPEARGPDELLDAWFTLADVARAVADTGASVTVLQAATSDAALERDGVAYRFLHTPTVSALHRRAGLWATPLPPELEDALREARPDVVHVHSLSFPRHLAAVRRALPSTPILVQDHKERPPNAWLRPLHRRALREADGVTFSAAEQSLPFFREGLFRAGLPIYVIPETSSRFVPGPREAARQATGLHGTPAFLWVGHLDANKDPLTVLAAARKAFPSLPDPHLWMAYQSEPLGSAVRAAVADAEVLHGRVHLLGRRSPAEVELLMRAADAFVLGSHEEGSGVALIEALACGTPPIVTDIPSFRELTGHGAVGSLYTPGDADGMALHMVAFLTGDPADRRAAVRRHFETRLAFPVVGAKLVEAYRDLVSRRGGTAPGRRTPAVTFGPYRAGDEDELVQLFRTSFGRTLSPEAWRWKLLGRAGSGDTVLVGRDTDGRPVFQMGGIPRTAEIRGETVRVMVAVDAMTRPDRRGHGILTAGCLELFARWRAQGIAFVLGLPNEQWGSRTAACGWHPLLPLGWRVRLLRPEAILARRTRVGAVAKATALGTAWNAWWERGGAEPGLSIEPGPPPAAAMDIARGPVDGLGLRGGEAWARWRYQEAPAPTYAFLTASMDGRPVGWLAYTMRTEGERSFGIVAELVARPEHPEVERALLRAVARRLRSEGAELVAALTPTGTARDRTLRATGYRPAWGSFLLHAAVLDPSRSIEELRDPAAWRLEAGDFDVV